MKAPLPIDEPSRLAALHDAGVLDTAPEEDFDDIALLASEVCGTPMGLVSFVADDRQWFKAKVGVGHVGTDRELSFCAHAINGHELLEVPDTTMDARFADNPSVELRRYARHAGNIADRLRRLDRMKDSFLTTVSHELRTPLSTIRGYLEMLLEGDFDGETSRRFLSVMQRNSDRLLRLIDELLLVARLTEEGMQLDVVELDLADLAHQVTTACRPLAEHKQVRLNNRATRPVPARGDAKRLAQALNHLVVNAIKFTSPGGDITVESFSDGEPELTITDNGVGIPVEELTHVFDRFYRCATADVMAVQGPGLGLAIVKSIIDAHHGSVHLESMPGAGTTVRLTLPSR